MYRIQLGDNTWVEVGTLEEVAQYQALLEARRKANVAVPPKPTPMPAPDVPEVRPNVPRPIPPEPKSSSTAWTTFIRELQAAKYRNQRQILAYVKKADQMGITREDLGRKLGLANQGVGGAVAGITKVARSQGIPDVTVILKTFQGAYFAGPLLLANDLPEGDW